MKWMVLLGACAVILECEGQPVQVDTAFDAKLDGDVGAIALQSDGRILVGGAFTHVNGTQRTYVVRLFADGTLDPSFAVAPEDQPGAVGRIVVYGTNIYVSGSDGIRRFDWFGTKEAFYPAVRTTSFAVDSKRRVIATRDTEYLLNERLTRYREDGARDNSFNVKVGCCPEEGVYSVLIQTNDGTDKIVFGGEFTRVNDTPVNWNLTRVNEDGSVDSTFVGGANRRVMDLKFWNDGKIYLASSHHVGRYRSDGSVDAPWAYVGSHNFILSIAPQADGGVIVGGQEAWAVRFRADGTLDTDFCLTFNAPYIYATAIQADGGILVGGNFREVNGVERTGLVRLISSDVPPPEPCNPLNWPAPPPPPPPEIELTRVRGGRMLCCWPTNYPEYTLQATRRLRPNHPEREKWVTVTNEPVAGDATMCVTNRIARWGKHYRLVKE